VPGSPVYYKSFEVGTIESVALDDNFNFVEIKAFIEAPYDQLVHQDSRFWNVSGISASINSEGISVNFQSVESLLIGGIQFDSPSVGRDPVVVESGQRFRLYESYVDLGVESFSQKIFYIVNFKQSIRGLNIDAAVEYRGLKIGRVVNISSEYDATGKEILLPVLIEIEPERLGIEIDGEAPVDKAHQAIRELKLHAKLELANLITGQLFVTLDNYDDKPYVVQPDFNGFKQLPTISTDLNRIAANVDEALEKINSLEIEALVDNLNATVLSIKQTIESADSFVGDTGESVDKVVKSLESTLRQGRQLLESGKVMFDQGQTVIRSLDEGSATRYQLDQTLKDLQAAAKSLKTLTETIEKNPNSLIFGKQK